MPQNFPARWASGWGEDEYGLWMSFTFKGVQQSFRWIKPGTFMMGSPESEKERSRREIQHEVTLSSGFWLADTACTQELWETVMGSNPSYFKGKKLPVENVSWEDCDRFVQKMNSLLPSENICLPTEAQWEYACRAETTTAFSFGESITKEQVNYGSKVTVEVKSLPCNLWGLYEMHGNVFEWCYDWYDDYQIGNVIDPTGPNSGSLRVMRGGNWGGDSSGLVRSAYRFSFEPDDRNDYIGFRFCLRSQKGSGATKVEQRGAAEQAE
ncbi:formylglycine-generating enzyme family protein [Candidatus Uabimicrobium sp. HlEnr_7]|uniref:formylglycine-generating enzyme family protein n=1 Tax=Candidatus Uabimicrobium helgolandensis TaxID=3095367 RepID=UPI0035577549